MTAPPPHRESGQYRCRRFVRWGRTRCSRCCGPARGGRRAGREWSPRLPTSERTSQENHRNMSASFDQWLALPPLSSDHPSLPPPPPQALRFKKAHVTHPEVSPPPPSPFPCLSQCVSPCAAEGHLLSAADWSQEEPTVPNVHAAGSHHQGNGDRGQREPVVVLFQGCKDKYLVYKRP